ncbi:DUF4294 domain-containing protein [Leeuwenhoekiella marinoflava]|uniref:DUF4294 domain-containing protein n=2 Tax=Leeuwenhoekiella marinoflava TaxID=988 RepID=A0A4Q0PRB7_9FLAO|nr:DUF4294 domain-containing protein [Leeuwenhoekiella marinoflava]RXG32792.1 putative protein DUF4294 [Leeuwenhoekiella marinoflava]SHE56951.1 protein of unknown function [Leeuwenhoekiella marinoflava DSM 3653]
MKNYILFFVLLFSIFLRAQTNEETEKETDTTDTEYYFVEGDSIARSAIFLEDVIVLSRLKFDDNTARRRYLILRRKTRKVWPYAKLAGERLVELNERLDSMQSKRDRKRYTKIIQRYVENEFKEELKKLTRTEGQILVKLMYRQTGQTTFELIKNYRSGLKAFLLNTTASFFDISLKEIYDPEDVQEDYLIEDILQRSFQAKILEKQEPAIELNFLELENKWRKPKPDRGIK